MDQLADAAALVTGASAGIGRATAAELAARGADVALVARSETELNEAAGAIADEHGVETVALPADVGDRTAVDDAVSTTVERFGGLDVLVSNAGVGAGFGERVDDLSDDAFEAMQRTNADGAFYATRAALPHLRERDGNLVFVGSFAGKYPYSVSPVYAATKAWLRSFALSVEAAEGENGVAVTVVNPGGVRTGFDGDGVTQADRYAPGEAPEPEEVAEAVALAVTRPESSTVSEVDLFRRDQLEGF